MTALPHPQDNALTLRSRVSEAWAALAADPALSLLAFVILTLPFELSKQLFPFQVIEISRIGMAAGVLMLIVRAARRDLVRPPRSLVAATIGLLVMSGLSLLATRWPQGIRIEAAMAAYAVFALFVAQAVRSERAVRVALVALAVSGVVVGLILIAETLGGFYLWYEHSQSVLGRRNGPFADPNIASRFLAIAAVGVMALVGMPGAVSKAKLPWPLLTLFTIGVGDAMTQSRAGWIVAGVAVLAWFVVASSRRRAALAIAAFLVGFVGTIWVNPKALIRAEGFAIDAGQLIGNLTGGPADGPGGPGIVDTGPPLAIDPVLNRMPLDGVRRYLARAGFAMFIDHPVAGVGLGGFQPEILGPYQGFIPSDRRASPVSLPHTEAVRIAAETGIVGLVVCGLFFLAVFLALARVARGTSELRAPAAGVGLGLVIIGIASQFEGRLFDEPYLWLLIGLAAGLGAISRARPRVVDPGPAAG